MQYVIYIIFLLFSAIGLAELIHAVWLFLSTQQGKNNKILICYLTGDKPDLELRYVIEQIRWQGSRYADRVVAISNIDDLKLLNKCTEIASKSDVIFINSEYTKSEN